jgi:hypothetical protein
VKVNRNKFLYQNLFFLARELITDHELHCLASKYHNRHPTFTIDIQERTCHTIILACVYYYRYIQLDLRCQCIYNDYLHKFESSWSTDNIEYKNILNEIILQLNFSSTNRSLDDQIETIIEHITKYFIQEGQQPSTIITANDSIKIIKYERSPQSRRKQFLERSISWSQPLTRQSIQNSCLIEKKV